RHVCRPDLWRQQGFCRVATGGFSRRTADFHQDRHGEQTSVQACANHWPVETEGRTMATEKTHVVIVSMGAVGGILAAELGKAGMKVIGLESGPRLSTADFSGQDELRYFQRQDLRPNAKRQPVTWRASANAAAKPPLLADQSGLIFEEGAHKLGHHPFSTPRAILSQSYHGRPSCTYCGFCQAFGCHVGAKSSILVTKLPEADATGNFKLLTGTMC